MGISVSIFEGSVPYHPVEIELVLTCDGCFGGSLFPPTRDKFQHPEGFMGCYRVAMKAGWKDTFRKGERVFFGPCCSGKRNLAHREESDE